MLAFIKNNPTYAAVTAQLRYPNGEIQRTGSQIPTWFSLLLDYSLLGQLLPGWRKRVHDEMFYADWDRCSDREVKVAPGSLHLDAADGDPA